MGEGSLNGPLRVLVVDDNEGIRNLLRALARGDTQIEIVADAVDGEDAIRHAATVLPDVVVLDVDMPNTDGIRAIAGISAVAPATRIVMFSAITDRREEAKSAGADDWVAKGEPWDVLRDAILGRTPAAA